MSENLLDYASDSLINAGSETQEPAQPAKPAQQELGQTPMIGSEQGQDIARQATIDKMNNITSPLTAGRIKEENRAAEQNQAQIDPELIFEGNAEKAGKSLVAGVGVVVEDMGNMMDYMAMAVIPEGVRRSDTFLNVVERMPSLHQYADQLQNWGKVNQSPGLDEFTIDDMFKMEFWATTGAKALPYIATMAYTGGAGAKIATGLMKAGLKKAAKGNAFGSAKRLLKVLDSNKTAKALAKGSTTGVEGASAATGGSGLLGAMATQTAGGELALSTLGASTSRFLGAASGTTFLTSAGHGGDAYNRAIEMGMPEDQAQEAAHGTFIDESKWFLLNGLSWGIQFGGASGKAFKMLNKLKGGAESAKVIQKTFGQRLFTHAAKGGATGIVEGTEEAFQETYEDWCKEKNLAEARGEEFISYTEFLTSDENRNTLGISFAIGFAMGGRGGFMDSVAENGRRITNKRVSIDDDINMYENMSEAQKKIRTSEIIQAAVKEDQVEGLVVMLDKLEKSGKINKEERNDYDNIIEEYSTIAATLPFQESLTEAGQIALFNLKVKQVQNSKAKNNLESLKNKNIQEANENLEGPALKTKLAQIESQHEITMGNLNKEIQENKGAVSKLLTAKKHSVSAKKADQKRVSDINEFVKTEEYTNLTDGAKTDLQMERINLNEKIKEDSYIVDEATVMNESEFEQFTKEGAEQKAVKDKQAAEDVGQKAQDAVDTVADTTKEVAKTTVEKSKGLFEKGKELFGKAYNATKDFAKKQALSFKESSALRRVTNPIKQDIQKLVDEGKSSEEISSFIKSKISPEQIEKAGLTREKINKIVDDASKFYAESATPEAVRKSESGSKKPVVTDEVYKNFVDTGKVGEDVIEDLAMKLIKGESFTTQEEDIRTALSQEIENWINESETKRKLGTNKKSQPKQGQVNKTTESLKAEAKIAAEKAKKTYDQVLSFTGSQIKNISKSIGKLNKKFSGTKRASKVVEDLKKIYKKQNVTVFKKNTGMKKSKGTEETTQSILSYYASINPTVQGVIIEAAAKKFPNKQLLILREVIDDHGNEVAGYAMGSAVLAKQDGNLREVIMHEYGHVYYDMLKDNPSFQRGVSKIIGTKIFKDTKKRYAELVKYRTKTGVIVTPNEIINNVLQNNPTLYAEEINALVEAVNAGDSEVINDLSEAFINKMQEDKEIEILPDEEQADIIEESFVTSLAPKLSSELNVLFEKPAEVKEYKSFLKRTATKVASMFTPADSKKILAEVDRSFDNLTVDEMYAKIADDFTKGTQGGSLALQSSKSKQLKLGDVNKTFAASISVALNKFTPNMLNTMSNQELAKKAIDFATMYSKKAGEEIKLSKELREEVERRVLMQQEAAKGFSLSVDTKTGGISNIYQEAKMKREELTEAEQEQESFEEVDSLVDDINIISDDTARLQAMDNSTSEFIAAIMKIANPDSRSGQRTRYRKSELEARLLNMAHSNRDSLNDFISDFNKSNEVHVKKARDIMNERLSKGEMLSALKDMHNNYRNKFIEDIMTTTITTNGEVSQSLAIHDSERKIMNEIKKASNEVFFKGKSSIQDAVLTRIKRAEQKLAKGEKLTQEEGLNIAIPILRSAEIDQQNGIPLDYIDYSQLSNIRVSRGNKIFNVQDYIADIIMDKNLKDKKTGKTYISQGKIPVVGMMDLFKNVVTASRSKNAIKSVIDVNGNTTLGFNFNNSLINKKEEIVNLAKTEKGRIELVEKYLMDDNGNYIGGNPFIEMAVGLGANGMSDQSLQIAFDGGVSSYYTGEQKGVKYENQTQDDIIQFDLEKFASNWDGGKPGNNRSFYTQPISIFANSKRRYNISSPMATTEGQKSKVVKALIAKGADKTTYRDGDSALGFTINKDGSYDIQEQVQNMKDWILSNASLVKNNPVMKSFVTVNRDTVSITKEGNKMIDDYVFNYMVNSFYAQQLFVGDHSQAESQKDYIKRATGAIARQDGSMRGVSIEPLIYDDIIENGVKSSDAGSFILPEDVDMVRDKVGKRIGRGFKFVYYGKDMRGEKANKNVGENNTIGESDFYFKTYVQVLDKEFIKDSPILQKIEKELRARKKYNNNQQNIFNESLNIAMFASAAKKAPKLFGDKTSTDSYAEGSTGWNTMNNAYMNGNELVGLDGANMGIQLPMDKYREEVVEATQMSAADLNDLAPENIEAMQKILNKRQEILDLSLENSTKGIENMNTNGMQTPDSRAASKKAVVKTITKGAVSSSYNGTAKFLNLKNPKISQNLPSVNKFFGNGLRSLVKKSSKVMTAGTIAVQGVASQKGLKGYFVDGKEYIGSRYEVRPDGTLIKKSAILPAEAIVPAGLKGKYFARVDQEFTSEFEAKTYADSLVSEKVASTALGTSGVRIQGLNREFPSVRAAKEFLYNKIALWEGKYMILGEEFLGPRVPAHGQQSRPICEIKGFQKEVLDENGKHLNNHIQVSPELNKILGSDQDGDTLFLNFEYENPKNKREGLVNEMLDLQKKFYRDISHFKHLTADMEYESEVEERIKAIQSKFPNLKKRSPQNSPIGASQFFEENVQGSGMIGTIAALNNGMSYFSRYKIELGIKDGITVDGKKVENFSDNLELKGKDALSFKNAVLLNIALDNTKNQYATVLGINPSTVSAVALMNRLGFDTKSLDVIFNSPAAKMYTKFKGKKALKDKTFVDYGETSAAVLSYVQMFGDSPEVAKKQIANASKDGININTSLITGKSLVDMDSNERREMANILAMFEASEGITKDVYSINNLLGQHKNVAFNEQEVSDQIKEYNKILDGESTVKGEQELKELKNSPVLKSFMNRLVKTSTLYQENDITGTPHAETTFNLLKSMTNSDTLSKRSGDEQSKIIKDYFVNVLANTVPMFKQTLKHTGDFGGRNPEPKVNKLVRSVLERLETQKDNAFVRAINFTYYEGFGDRAANYSLKPDSDYINKHTNETEIKAIKQGFSQLSPDLQNDLFIVDSLLNEIGYKNTSIQPLLSDNMLEKLSEEIDTAHQMIIDKDSDVFSPKVMVENIVMENPQIIPLGGRLTPKGFVKGYGELSAITSAGRAKDGMPLKLKAKDVANRNQEDLLKNNTEHYIKVTHPNRGVIVYKYKPYKNVTRPGGNKLDVAKSNGVYEYVGASTKTKPSKKTDITNYKKLQGQADKVTSLLKESKSGLKAMKFYNSKSGADSELTSYDKFSFEEYLEDKGHNINSVMSNTLLKESLEKLYKNYVANFNLAQEFDETVIQTGKIKTLANDKLYDFASLMQKLDPSAVSSVHKQIVLELAKRASEEQKASRNGIEWTDKGDISWLHSWFGSNNIPGHRPEIQKLVRTMEQEYGKFMEENIKFQKELDRLTKNLIREKIADNVNAASKGPLFIKWFLGNFPSWSGWEKKMYENMYDKVVTEKNGVTTSELKLKQLKDFLALNPTKSEVEFYTFFKSTTNKYGEVTKKALGERYKDNYIPHIKMGMLGSIKQRGVFGLYDYMLQGTGDINHVKVKGINPTTGKQEILPFHQWQLIYYTTEGKQGGLKQLLKGKQYKAAAKLDVIRKRAEGLAKSGKHDDGTAISMTEQEIHGTLGTNLMSRFTKSRGVKTSMFAGEDLGLALSQYVNTTLFTYGNENFAGFKSMSPLLDGVIEYNKKKGNENAVTYLTNVWKKGFYNFGDSQTGLGRLTDNAIHQLVKMTRLRFLSLSSTGGIGNLMVGKYNEFRSKGGKSFATGETRYWGQRKKSWALIKNQLNPESFAYDLIQGNDSSGFNSLMMSPYIGSEHYIQGSGFVSQFTKEEWNRIGEDGSVPADLQEKVDLYVDNVVRQQGYGYSKVDQVGIATYSWGKAIMQFKKWIPTAMAERFSKDTIDRFGEMRTGSNRAAFSFGADFARKVMAGEQSVKDFKKAFNGLPKERQEAVKTFFRGMQVVSALSVLAMMFGDSDDDELRGIAKFAGDTRDDIMFMTDPRRIKFMAQPASWSLVESGATMAVGIATMDQNKFTGGLSGISWTASQVLSSSSSAVKSIEQDI